MPFYKAKKLCENKGLIKDKVVLDAGCGVGLSSIVSSILGAKNVIALDISPVCLELGTSSHHMIISSYDHLVL